MIGLRAIAVTLMIAWVAAPGQAWGADAELSLGGGVEWDNNVGRTDGAADDDFVFQVRPKLRLLDDEGKAVWNLYYAPTYEKAVKSDAIDDLRHYFTGDGSYNFSDATEVFFADRLSLSDAVNTVTALDGDEVSTLSAENELVLRNQLSAGVHHSFTPRLIGSLTATHDLFRSDVITRSNNQSYGGNLNVRYALTARHNIGAGVAATVQDFEASEDGRLSASNSLFVNLFGTWSWLIDDTTNFEITIGPTFIDSDQDAPPAAARQQVVPTAFAGGGVVAFDAENCPTLSPGVFYAIATSGGLVCDGATVPLSDNDIADVIAEGTITPTFAGGAPTSSGGTNWTIFGEATLSKRWTPNLKSRLSYTRRDSTASGVGGATVLDHVAFFTSWRINELWDTSVLGGWSMRQSTRPRQQTFIIVANELLLTDGLNSVAHVQGLQSALVQSAVDTTTYRAAWRLTRRLTKRFSVSTRYTFARQNSDADSNGVSSDFTDHLVTLNFQYDFDRLELW